jgi:hypothetical protein
VRYVMRAERLRFHIESLPVCRTRTSMRWSWKSAREVREPGGSGLGAGDQAAGPAEAAADGVRAGPIGYRSAAGLSAPSPRRRARSG